MPDESTPTEATPEPTISGDELRDVLGDELDARLEARGLTTDRIQRLDMLDKLEETFTGLFAANKSEPVDKDGLLTEFSKMLDERLSKLGGTVATGTENVERKVGPLGRYLGFGTSRN